MNDIFATLWAMVLIGVGIASTVVAFIVIWYLIPFMLVGAAILTGIYLLIGASYYVINVLRARGS